MPPSFALNTAVHNEADRIIGLLTHASYFCEELVVVDCSSTDGTAETARDFGALVISDIDYGYAEPSRELASTHTNAPWILVLDADEYMTREAVEAMKAWTDPYESMRFSRQTWVAGRNVTPVYPDGTMTQDTQLRAFMKGRVTYPTGPHSKILPNQPQLCYTVPVYPGMLNVKSQAELDRDETQSARVMAKHLKGV